MCFFFQAEDGIRDLVRSRGLGDVYKRQRMPFLTARSAMSRERLVPGPGSPHDGIITGSIWSVSYTHLTLPTSDLV